MTAKKSRPRAQVGKELAKLRIDLDETLGYMAERLGVHPVHLSKVESGSVAFSAALAGKVKDVYGVDLSSMISEVRSDRVAFQLSALTPEDRATILEIYNRRKEQRKNGSATQMPQAPSQKAAPSVPDVEGVDFLDDLDDLDDLD